MAASKRAVENLAKEVAAAMQKITASQTAVTTLEREFASETEKASRICPKVPVTQTASQLDKHIVALNSRLEKERQGYSLHFLCHSC